MNPTLLKTGRSNVSSASGLGGDRGGSGYNASNGQPNFLGSFGQG